MSNEWVTDAQIAALTGNNSPGFREGGSKSLPNDTKDLMVEDTPNKEVNLGREGSKSGPGRPAIYPWSTWANGKYHEATRGEDFKLSRQQFSTMLHNWAYRKGMFVATRQVAEDRVGFQFCSSKAGAIQVKLDWELAYEGQ